MAMASQPRWHRVIENTCLCIIGICCIPCIFFSLLYEGICAIFTYERPSTRRNREAREQEEGRARMVRGLEERLARTKRTQTPKILGPRLEGALTIGREVHEETSLSTHRVIPVCSKETLEQLQSSLFRLPLEVRIQIYKETIGGYMIHIYYEEAYKRIGHVRCKTFYPETCTCRNMHKQKGVPDPFGNVDLLAPLKSCRRVYSEAVEILYKSNTFDFDYLGNVIKLSLLILPERMRLIGNVQWEYYHEYSMLQSIATATNEEQLSAPTLAISRPWYNCRATSGCLCLDCWTKFHSRTISNHKFVIYDWVVSQRNGPWERRYAHLHN